ncbi:hypothetical protein VCG_000129 [Vibrio cholerae 12129(1)]|nr:hypothetical protein VCG_000129 [Vibrio cholerae 12129(1)]EEO03041.1 hypothetical protein VCA_002037 [Vibrio cholerae VL426]
MMSLIINDDRNGEYFTWRAGWRRGGNRACLGITQ